jgi:hypothetical protein
MINHLQMDINQILFKFLKAKLNNNNKLNNSKFKMNHITFRLIINCQTYKINKIQNWKFLRNLRKINCKNII